MAALVLAGPVSSQGKSKILFLQKESNKQSASMILGLIRLIILSYQLEQKKNKELHEKLADMIRTENMYVITSGKIVRRQN